VREDEPNLVFEKNSNDSASEENLECRRSLGQQPFGLNIFPQHDSLRQLCNLRQVPRLIKDVLDTVKIFMTYRTGREGGRRVRTIIEYLIICQVIDLIILSKTSSPEIIWIEMSIGGREERGD
jgi:hypothetical protein